MGARPADNGGSTDFVGRIPFASLIALVMCWIGVALFCAMEYQAISTSIEQVSRISSPNLPWLDKIQLGFILVAVIMCIVALVLLIVGALATGSTRKRVYQGWQAAMGGRISCMIFMILSYLIHVGWMLLASLAGLFCFVYYVLGQLCQAVGSVDESACLNLTLFRPLVPGTPIDKLVICGTDLNQFCVMTYTASTWYYIGYIGAIIVCLALVHYLIVLASNYAHIKDGSKYMELQEIWQFEENEMAGPPNMGYRHAAVPKSRF